MELKREFGLWTTAALIIGQVIAIVFPSLAVAGLFRLPKLPYGGFRTPLVSVYPTAVSAGQRYRQRAAAGA